MFLRYCTHVSCFFATDKIAASRRAAVPKHGKVRVSLRLILSLHLHIFTGGRRVRYARDSGLFVRGTKEKTALLRAVNLAISGTPA